jgi:hypothetical protein
MTSEENICTFCGRISDILKKVFRNDFFFLIFCMNVVIALYKR